jgi:exodeoxyribonuclease VII large subunit
MRAGQAIVEHRRERLAAVAAGLQARSPLATLARGYAIVTDTASGALVQHPQQLAPGAQIAVRVQGGCFAAQVTDRFSPEPPAPA